MTRTQTATFETAPFAPTEPCTSCGTANWAYTGAGSASGDLYGRDIPMLHFRCQNVIEITDSGWERKCYREVNVYLVPSDVPCIVEHRYGTPEWCATHDCKLGDCESLNYIDDPREAFLLRMVEKKRRQVEVLESSSTSLTIREQRRLDSARDSLARYRDALHAHYKEHTAWHKRRNEQLSASALTRVAERTT